MAALLKLPLVYFGTRIYLGTRGGDSDPFWDSGLFWVSVLINIKQFFHLRPLAPLRRLLRLSSSNKKADYAGGCTPLRVSSLSDFCPSGAENGSSRS